MMKVVLFLLFTILVSGTDAGVCENVKGVLSSPAYSAPTYTGACITGGGSFCSSVSSVTCSLSTDCMISCTGSTQFTYQNTAISQKAAYSMRFGAGFSIGNICSAPNLTPSGTVSSTYENQAGMITNFSTSLMTSAVSLRNSTLATPIVLSSLLINQSYSIGNLTLTYATTTINGTITLSFMINLQPMGDFFTLLPTSFPIYSANSFSISRSSITAACTPVVDESSSVCFPATATVQLANGSTVDMQSLQTGDKVLVGGGEYSEVFMWSHRYPEAVNSFVQLTTKSGTSITLTAGHYLYVNGVLATAGSVQKGDQLATGSGAKSPVISIKTITANGLFNPHTMHGDIVVDGIHTSTYTEALNPTIAHGLLGPARVMYAAGLDIVGNSIEKH